MATLHATALTRMQYVAIVWCHMIITNIPHVMNLIDVQEFRKETVIKPKKMLWM